MFFLGKIGHHNPIFWSHTFSVIMVNKTVLPWEVCLGLPAGGIESNESPRQAKRELEEETEFPFAQISY